MPHPSPNQDKKILNSSLFTSIDPSNDQIIWQGYEATSQGIDNAFKFAKSAFSDWSLSPLEARINYLQKYSQVLTVNKESFAKAISQETGKPLWDASGEVSAMINKVAISIEAYAERCPERSKKQPQGMSICRHKPHGVLAVFGPYNFPGHLPNGHIIPALLAGNTIIFKPSELTPLVAELMMQYWKESGLPNGVLNLLQGGKCTGELIITHPSLDGLLFTGSWQTGCFLAKQFAKTPHKILALEMGGNNPLIVSKISDPATCAYLTIVSAFLSSGQRCTCARRLIVIKNKINEDFIHDLIRMTQSINVGAYTDSPEPFMGPVISASIADKLLEQQHKLVNLGGKSLISMLRTDRGKAYLSPGIIDMTEARERPDEEIFGPLLQIIYVENLKEAIAAANATAYGLAAGIFTEDASEYREFYSHVKAGVINWNTPLTGASSAAPFGGIGKSGNNRPSAFYAADYCAYPVASIENSTAQTPHHLAPGITICHTK